MEGSPSDSAPAPDEAEVHPLFMTSLPPGWEDNPGLQAIAAVIDEADSAAMEVGGAGGGGDGDDTDGADTDGAVSGLQRGSDGDGSSDGNGSSDDDYGRPSNSRSKSKPAKSAGKKKTAVAKRKSRAKQPKRGGSQKTKTGMAQVSLSLL
mmetsp:Transcript_24042/g.47830  ORF Transcript_24042/g.47830 Transcript_24042/m.47830 type:complete len:150 (+) Transcript_24042:416-865(+)